MTSLSSALSSLLLQPPRTARAIVGAITRRNTSLRGTTVVITGASSGIGAATAQLFTARGARVIAVARNDEALRTLCAQLDQIAPDGPAAAYVTADIADADSAAELAATILDTFGPPDILVNNAGRSIRRSTLDATDRFHDYQRTMALNYFGPVQLILGLLPAMADAGRGQIINVVTWGVTAGAMPKFAAYHASKAALAAFGRSLDAECADTGIQVSNVGFPLVRTPMIAPTADYDDAPALSADQAAEWILRAAIDRPAEIYPRYAVLLRTIANVSPRAVGRIVRSTGI